MKQKFSTMVQPDFRKQLQTGSSTEPFLGQHRCIAGIKGLILSLINGNAYWTEIFAPYFFLAFILWEVQRDPEL